MILLLYFFSYDITKFMYFRGAFTIEDVQQTSLYLYQLCYSFLFLFVATILFQPFLSLPISETKDIRLKLSNIFLIVLFSFKCCCIIFRFFSSRESIICYVYVINFSSFLAFFSYKKYQLYEK